MTDSTTDIKDIRVVKQCNFCGKSKEQVYKVIVADNVGICDECIELCNKVLTDEKAKAGVQNLKPKSAKEN